MKVWLFVCAVATSQWRAIDAVDVIGVVTLAPITLVPDFSVSPVVDGTSTVSPVTPTSPVGPTTAAPVVTISPVSTSPITTSPITSSPVTASPVTVSPVTASPVTEAPITISPVTTTPVTIAPITIAPVTTAPITLAPITMAPVGMNMTNTTNTTTMAPVTLAPVTLAPVTAAPITSQPSGTRKTDDILTCAGVDVFTAQPIYFDASLESGESFGPISIQNTPIYSDIPGCSGAYAQNSTGVWFTVRPSNPSEGGRGGSASPGVYTVTACSNVGAGMTIAAYSTMYSSSNPLDAVCSDLVCEGTGVRPDTVPDADFCQGLAINVFSVTFNALDFRDYFIYVLFPNGANVSSVNLHMTSNGGIPFPVPNDAFVNAQNVGILRPNNGTTFVTGTLIGSTQDRVPQCDQAGYPMDILQGVWYKGEGSLNDLSISVCGGQSADASLFLYEETMDGNLTCISTTRICDQLLEATPDSTYYFYIFATSEFTFPLTISKFTGNPISSNGGVSPTIMPILGGIAILLITLWC